MNNATINICSRFYCKYKFSFQISRGVGPHVKCMFNLRKCQIVLAIFHFALLPAIYEKPSCSASSSICYCRVHPSFLSSCLSQCSNRNAVVFHFVFNLHFPNDESCSTCFHMSICHLYIFSDEASILGCFLIDEF